MTLYKPTLILTRLVLTRGVHTAYSEKFHKGVNIIRGSNGGGKTTIVESIIYALGGDIGRKKDEFLLCDYVFAELLINDKPYTFKRAIEKEGYPSIDIFEGTYDSSKEAPDLWTRYPNRRTENQKSYSEIIFSLLNFPEERVDGTSNITIHDILRLVYEDQQTSSDKIFQSPSFPEGNSRRQAISDLLLGIDDLGLHQLRLQLAEKEKQFASFDGQLKQIYKILGASELDVSTETLRLRKRDLEEEQRVIAQKIDLASSNESENVTSDAQKIFKQIKQQLTKLKQSLHDSEETRISLELEIGDSKEFIESLAIKLEALTASTGVTKALGGIDFTYCPCCLQVLEELEDNNTCDLCKSSIHDDGKSLGYLKMRNEIAFQKRESEDILKRKEIKLGEIKISIQKTRSELTKLEREHSNYINAVSPLEAEIRNLISRVGYIDREIQDLLEKEKLSQRIEEIRSSKGILNEQISLLKDSIAAADALREKNRSIVYSALNDQTLELIKKDPSQELAKVDGIKFDFGKDDVFAVGKDSPAASTGTYLKNSFFFSIFLVSLQKSFVRYPRFIILDNIEDSGLETERVRQFHNDIIAKSNATTVQHQIIFTARSETLSPDLDNSDLCVGKKYNCKTGIYSLEFITQK